EQGVYYKRFLFTDQNRFTGASVKRSVTGASQTRASFQTGV
ncbi:MAG: hypothetical protein AVDCRST_MAG95-3111, partial [uncultured Adhaeribacter sp.]